MENRTPKYSAPQVRDQPCSEGVHAEPDRERARSARPRRSRATSREGARTKAASRPAGAPAVEGGHELAGRCTKVLVFLVAYNEEKNIGELIGEIRDKVKLDGLPWELLVVDDGSTDLTGAVSKSAGARVVRHPVNLGIGAAEQTGLLFARRNRCDIAVRMDGDGQHPPEAAWSLVREVAGGEAHLAVGSRFVDRRTGGFKSTLLRRIGIVYFSWLCRFLTGRKVKDPTSGLRCFGRESIELLTSLPPADYPEVESFMDAVGSGLTVKEVPVPFRSRKSGASTIKFFQSLYFMIKVSLAIMVAALREPPSWPKG